MKRKISSLCVAVVVETEIVVKQTQARLTSYDAKHFKRSTTYASRRKGACKNQKGITSAKRGVGNLRKKTGT